MANQSNKVNGSAPKSRSVLLNVSGQAYADNYIKTTKFTVWSFLPLALLYQYKRLANWYFLALSILGAIPGISPWSPVTQITPTVFVLMVAVVREGVEDYMRYRADRHTNQQLVCKVTEEGKRTPIQSAKIKVGDLLWIEDGQELPADVVLFTSSDGGTAGSKGSTTKDGQAQCFIQTSSLDGEKTLKKRVAPKGIQLEQTQEGKYPYPQGELICDLPNPDLYEFRGQLHLGAETTSRQTFALSANQLLLKGSKLMNTEWIIGCVVYSGLDTKLMQNQNSGRFKQSNVEKESNKTVVKMLCFHVLVSTIQAIIATNWNAEYKERALYLFTDWQEESNFTSFILAFFGSICLNSTFIPISLLVAIELVKVTQAWFLTVDVEMCSAQGDGKLQPCQVNTAALNEELGQVRYVFSDKTGTLTQNIMEFRMCMIGKQIYGDQHSVDALGLSMSDLESSQYSNRSSSRSHNKKQGTSYNYKNQMLEELLQGNLDAKASTRSGMIISSNNHVAILKLSNQRDLASEFLKALASAHQCMIEQPRTQERQSTQTPNSTKQSSTKITYQGSSPDEITLVEMAQQHGYEYIFGNDELLKIQTKSKQEGIWVDEDILEMRIIRIVEFSSERKMMSILVQDKSDGMYKLYCKGADSVIIERLQEELEGSRQVKETKQFLHKASMKGYRTLLIAMRILDEAEVNEYVEEFKKADGDFENREQRLAEIADGMERNLVLLGATVVEDRLQDEVPEMIQALHQGDIKVWMLTGDKMETAESIGLSCQLLTADMDIMRCSTLKDLQNNFNQKQATMNEELIVEGKKRAIIIEASALKFILDDLEPAITRWFLKISRTMETVICCRVSPSQKAAVVKMMKRDDPALISLAIGDGANDVSMILEADIGVGLFGREGHRAVDSSDFAIAEFRFLWQLIFKHGRWNYQRMGVMINYFFYKNFVYTLMQLLYSMVCGYSGQSIFPDLFLSLYNLVFTAFPICAYATWEKDVYPIDAVDGFIFKPYVASLYFVGQRNLTYNQYVAFLWTATGMVQAIIIFIIPCCAYDAGIMNQDGFTCDLWLTGMTIFTSLLFVVHNKLMVHQKFFDFMVWTSYMFCSYGLFYLYSYVSDDWYTFVRQHFTFFKLYRSPQFYAVVILSVSICFLLDFLMECANQFLLTDPRDLLRRVAISGSLDEAFRKEFEELTRIQRHLAVQEDQLREQQLDNARATKIPTKADATAAAADVQQLSAKGRAGLGALSVSLSQVFAASRPLKADPALSDASSLTTFGGMMRRYGSPTKIKEQALSQTPSSGQSIAGGLTLEKKFGAGRAPRQDKEIQLQHHHGSGRTEPESNQQSVHVQMNTLQAQAGTPHAAQQSGPAPTSAPGAGADHRHHDAASVHDAGPLRSNYINTQPDLENSSPPATTKTEQKGKVDPPLQPPDEARHITAQSEHGLTNGSADPRI